VVQAYLASITFADACVGRVMDEMEKSPDAGNTIIILFGDNGWHLGEKNHWQKCTLWERSAHIPLMIYAPGLTPSSGGVCTRPVSLVDLYPTLVELCGLPPREGLDGHSLVPLLKSPSAAWAYPAITTYQRGNHAVRSEQWRYIRYHDGTEELYNMMKDPNEWHNLARDPEYQTVLAEHRMWLPKTDAEAVVRSNESDERFNPGGTKRKSKTEPSE
jgi:arylsulfatase A-like enzyme